MAQKQHIDINSLTKLEIMKYNIGLTTSLDIFNPNANSKGILVDYTKITNNFISKTTDRGTGGAPILGKNEDWQLVGETSETIGNIGYMFKSRILEAAGTALTDNEKIELNKVAAKINNRINDIVTSPNGIDDIFKYKSQYVARNGSKICEGGPTGFFRFLFDFAIPSKVSIRNDILEFPTAGTANGQCFKVYPTGCLYPHPPKWSFPSGSPAKQRMACYICDVDLNIGKIFPPSVTRKNMQCEHLFPFIEGILFWVLWSNAISVYNNPGYSGYLKTIQRREYAPVCQDCNCRLKSSIGILRLNPDWKTNPTNPNLDIVQIIPDSLQKIACFPARMGMPAWDREYHQSDSGLNYNARLTRLYAVFTPLVEAINFSLKKRNINSTKKLSQFLIYKYLTYFGDRQIAKLKQVFVGGEDMKKINEEKKKKNRILEKMIKILIGYVKLALQKLKQTNQKVIKATRKADELLQKFTDRIGRRGSDKREAEAKEAARVADDAKQKKDQSLEITSQVEVIIASIIGRISSQSSSSSSSLQKLEALKQMIKSNPNEDHMKNFNINEAGFEEIQSEATSILNILNGTSSSGASTGGGKIQKGGNIFSDSTGEEDKKYIKLVCIYALAINDLQNNSDYDMISALLKTIDNELVDNNKNSYDKLIKKNKEIINSINDSGTSWEERTVASCINVSTNSSSGSSSSSGEVGPNVCMDDSCLEEECNEELPSLLEFLNEIDQDNAYLQWDGKKWSQDASSTASDPILIDKNTKDTRNDMRQLQEVLTRQSLLGRYGISDDNYLPELMLLREKWRESSNERCLECAKKVNTQGWKAVRIPNSNQYDISPSRVTINSKIKYTLKDKYFQTKFLGSNPIIFCSRHGNKFLKNNFKDNLNELNTVNTAYFSSLSGSFPIKKATALVMEKFPQEREEGQRSITGFLPPQQSPQQPQTEAEPEQNNNNKRKSPTQQKKKAIKRTKKQININQLRFQLYERVIDFVNNGIDDRPDVPSQYMRGVGWWRNNRTQARSSGRSVTYPIVVVPTDHVSNLNLIDRFILAQRVLCDRSNNVITNPDTLYTPELEIFICGTKTFEEIVEQLFEIYKPLFLRGPVGNGNALHFWKNNEQLFPRNSGGRRKKKTRRRRNKKKRTRRKNKRKKKTKRRRKRRKKTKRRRKR